MHLFVVGPPGIGKSTVAPLLAGMLGASVVETDRAIARRARKSNKDLIEQDGMEAFRDVESRVEKAKQLVRDVGTAADAPGFRRRFDAVLGR